MMRILLTLPSITARNFSTDINEIMQNLLSQLAYSSEETKTFLNLTRFHDGKIRPNAKNCVSLLAGAIAEAGLAVIVLDGWDECDKPHALLGISRKFGRSLQP
jgi:hypothetical protein